MLFYISVSLQPVRELEDAEHRHMDIGSCDVVPNPIPSPLRVIEQFHLSSLAPNAKIITRNVTPDPAKAPAKKIASELIHCLLSVP